MTRKPLGWVRLAVLEVVTLLAVPGVWAATSGGWRIALVVLVAVFQVSIFVEAYRTWAARRPAGASPTAPS